MEWIVLSSIKHPRLPFLPAVRQAGGGQAASSIASP